MTAAFILPLHAANLRRQTHIPKRDTRRRHPVHATCERVTPNPAIPSAKSLHLLSGEWGGYEATFTSSGSVIPIADYYIPEEFREWGITPSGFECHTSVHATRTGLHRKHLRVLPAVSAFGDHIDVEEETRSVDMTERGAAVFEDGCWITGKEVVKVKENKLEKWPLVEMFMRYQGRGCGVKVRFNRESGCVVEDIGVVMYDWMGEYADSGVMEGGSGYMSGWVDQGGVVDVEGCWKTEDGDVVEVNGGVMLPGGVDVGARIVDGGCLLWAGWTFDELRLSLRRFYDGDGKLAFSERLTLRRE